MSESDHEHKLVLDTICRRCVISKYKKYDKLLAFVTNIAAQEDMGYHPLAKLANELLKEIGEDNEYEGN